MLLCSAIIHCTSSLYQHVEECFDESNSLNIQLKAKKTWSGKRIVPEAIVWFFWKHKVSLLMWDGDLMSVLVLLSYLDFWDENPLRSDLTLCRLMHWLSKGNCHLIDKEKLLSSGIWSHIPQWNNLQAKPGFVIALKHFTFNSSNMTRLHAVPVASIYT